MDDRTRLGIDKARNPHAYPDHLLPFTHMAIQHSADLFDYSLDNSLLVVHRPDILNPLFYDLQP